MPDLLHILVIEDNLADVQLIREILNERGVPHTLDVLSDGEQALKLAATAGTDDEPRCPDLLVLDLHLPKVDGPEVLRRFRANQHCAHTPVIVLSSFLSPQDRDAVESFSGVSYFSKPCNMDEVSRMGEFIHNILKA